MMRVVVIRHHDVDTACFIADAFEARGAEFAVHLFPYDGPLPAFDGVDHIVVMGAVSSVNDPDPLHRRSNWTGCARPTGPGCPCSASASAPRPSAPRWAAGSRPWRARRSAGSRSTPPTRTRSRLALGRNHGDRRLLPAFATVLARNDAAVQAFRIGRHFAVQFHPEVDGPQLKRWLDSMGTAEVEEASASTPTSSWPTPSARSPPPGPGRDRLVAAAIKMRDYWRGKSVTAPDTACPGGIADRYHSPLCLLNSLPGCAWSARIAAGREPSWPAS